MLYIKPSSHHHIVSAMALSHRTYPSFIFAMSFTLGLSPTCVQLVMMWFRSHVAAPHIQFCCPDSPTDVSLSGWQPVPSALGWPSAMHATAARDHSGVVLLGKPSSDLPPLEYLTHAFTCACFHNRTTCHHTFSNDSPSVTSVSPLTPVAGIVFTEGEVWREHRRFTMSCLRDFGMGKVCLEPKLHEEARYFLTEVAQHAGKPFDVTGYLPKTVSNVICSIIYGARFDYNDEVGTPTIWHLFPTRPFPGAVRRFSFAYYCVHVSVQNHIRNIRIAFYTLQHWYCFQLYC